jgi:hypothetical protein
VAALIAFVAYPSYPKDIGDTVKNAATELERYHAGLRLKPWEQLDIPGRFIADAVLDGIDDSDFLIADITSLNFNVTIRNRLRDWAGETRGLGRAHALFPHCQRKDSRTRDFRYLANKHPLMIAELCLRLIGTSQYFRSRLGKKHLIRTISRRAARVAKMTLGLLPFVFCSRARFEYSIRCTESSHTCSNPRYRDGRRLGVADPCKVDRRDWTEVVGLAEAQCRSKPGGRRDALIALRR